MHFSTSNYGILKHFLEFKNTKTDKVKEKKSNERKTRIRKYSNSNKLYTQGTNKEQY